MIDKFEKENPNIHIQMDSPSDAMTILKTRLVKENPPDIAILGGERSYADFVDADTIVDISDYKGLDKVKDVYKDMAKQLELSKKKGTYCVPYAANAAGVLYNRDMFKKYGWKIPETWDEFISLCKQIKSDGETPFYFMLKTPGQELLHGMHWQQTLLQQQFMITLIREKILSQIIMENRLKN